MKVKDQVALRLRDMLAKDKLKTGFVTAFKSDVTHLVKDYFDIDAIDFDFKETDNGKYEIVVVAKVSRIKQFETTM